MSAVVSSRQFVGYAVNPQRLIDDGPMSRLMNIVCYRKIAWATWSAFVAFRWLDFFIGGDQICVCVCVKRQEIDEQIEYDDELKFEEVYSYHFRVYHHE